MDLSNKPDYKILEAIIAEQDVAIQEDDVVEIFIKKQPRKRRVSSISHVVRNFFSTLIHHRTGPEFKYFFHLPLEIREQVYSYLLTSKETVPLDHSHDAGLTPAILQTCKQINQEATPILYKHNHLRIERVPRDWTELSTHSQFTTIRHLSLGTSNVKLPTNPIHDIALMFETKLSPVLKLRNMRDLTAEFSMRKLFPFELISEWEDMTVEEKKDAFVQDTHDAEDLLKEAGKYFAQLHGGLRFETVSYKSDELTGNIVDGEYIQSYVHYELKWSGYRSDTSLDVNDLSSNIQGQLFKFVASQ